MRALLALIGLWQMHWVETWEDKARFRLTCPEASCWHYWNGTCYCLEENQKGTWTEALKFCKRYTSTELVTLNSNQEKNWILDLPLDNFWIGLNNLEETQSFSWSEGTRANTSSWVQLSNPVQPNTCVKISKHSLVAVSCDTKAHWICQRSAVADRYQEHKGKVLLSPKGSVSQVHTDLISAKIACLELREQCTGITTWNNAYALARGTRLIKSKEKQSVAYVKSDCSFGYFGTNCSSVCNRCYGDELCNPYTGDCDIFHSCRSQDSPAVCEQDSAATPLSLNPPPHTAEPENEHDWMGQALPPTESFVMHQSLPPTPKALQTPPPPPPQIFRTQLLGAQADSGSQQLPSLVMKCLQENHQAQRDNI